MKTLKGNITIANTSTNIGPNRNFVSITINDELSGYDICRVEIDYECFGKAVAGIGRQKAKINLYDTGKIGKKRETKTEILSSGDISWWALTPDIRREIAEKYEVDGWVADESDLSNPHKIISNGSGCKVMFTRYAHAEEAKDNGH